MVQLILILSLGLLGGVASAELPYTVWETREIPVGKACPAQAHRYDDIAYQVGGDGGYVCFACDYGDGPFLVVTQQVKCPKTIECKNGKCK